MRIQLVWKDPDNEESQQSLLETPIALGRYLEAMPAEIDGQPVQRLMLNDGLISDYHASIVERDGEVIVRAENSSTIKINDVQLPSSTLENSDRLLIGTIEIQIAIGAGININKEGGCDQTIGFLFKRRCGRTDSTNCPDCRGGEIEPDSNDYEEYAYYPDYGRYDIWGRNYYYRRGYYYYDRETDEVEFTEADGAAFEEEMDENFEMDMGAS